ncbi:MAG: gamma-glutamylcyclotransferase family protein, partial [Bacteroidota bacterium]
ATATSVLYLTAQIKLQRNKSNTELVLNLYRDFFNNKSYSELFSIIDNDYYKMCDSELSLNHVLEVIIESEPFYSESIRDKRTEIESRFKFYLPEEKDLSNYMNFFNSVGKLIQENKEIKGISESIFKYQIEKTLSHPIVLNYLFKGKFEGVLAFEHKVNVPFFFYGTLKNIDDRNKNLEKKFNWEDNKKCKLFGYKMIEISNKDWAYPALIEDKNSSIQGVYTEAKEVNFITLFKVIDDYEEVGVLYERRIDWIQLDNSLEKKLCWIYFKKS